MKVRSMHALLSVLSGNRHALHAAFFWSDTPQGFDYWSERAAGVVPLSEDDRGYLIRQANKERVRS